jgi:dihydroneopterin aldolase/D-erythro-7,8-dihydroneopterin triphosphate epimerase
MTTTIYIRDLSLRCIIGIFPEEREKLQDVLINIELDCDIPNAAKSDSIEDTVNYKELNKSIIDMVEGSDFMLIETMADRIADLCFDEGRVLRVKVSVDKPGALRFARSVAVEISRTRD